MHEKPIASSKLTRRQQDAGCCRVSSLTTLRGVHCMWQSKQLVLTQKNTAEKSRPRSLTAMTNPCRNPNESSDPSGTRASASYGTGISQGAIPLRQLLPYLPLHPESYATAQEIQDHQRLMQIAVRATSALLRRPFQDPDDEAFYNPFLIAPGQMNGDTGNEQADDDDNTEGKPSP